MHHVIVLVIAALVSASVHAQRTDPVLAEAGWNALPDSLFLRWKLEDDQVKRLLMIEEDYEAARSQLMNDRGLETNARSAALRKLADARRAEVKGVLQPEHYDEWIGPSTH